MSAFRTTEAGVCSANCGDRIEPGDLVVMVNDRLVHLDCEDPEKAIAIARGFSFDVDEHDTLESAVRAAKVAAGLDPDAMYTPSLWVDHLDPSWVPLFWHWQVERVTEMMLEQDGPVLLCPCGEPATSHVHDALTPLSVGGEGS